MVGGTKVLCMGLGRDGHRWFRRRACPDNRIKGGLGALTRLNAGWGNEGRREGVIGGGRQTGRGG